MLADGEKRGIKKGKLEGKLETAERMLKKKFAIEDIMDITGLSRREIEALLKKNKKQG